MSKKFFYLFSIIPITNFLFFSSTAINSPSCLDQTLDNYALFFAVNKYEHMSDLTNPISDAHKIANQLNKYYNFQTEVIENPSYDDIELKLEEYKKLFNRIGNKNSESTKQLLIFFTGHGVREDKNGYFMPADGDPEKPHRTALSYSIWRPKINNINCKHILVAIDACFSATFDPDWTYKPKSGNPKFKRPGELGETQRLLQNHKKCTSRLFFTSDGNENETPDNSDFAKKFQQALGLYEGLDGDGLLTSMELFSVLEKARPKPYCGEFGDDEYCTGFLFQSIPITPNTKDINTENLEIQAWEWAKTTNSIEGYSYFLNQYPSGNFSQQAKNKINALELRKNDKDEKPDWDYAQNKDDIASYTKYLEKHPNSINSIKAFQRLEYLRWEETKINNTLKDYQAFVKDFPYGKHIDKAKFLKEDILKYFNLKDSKSKVARQEGKIYEKNGHKTFKGGMPISVQLERCYTKQLEIDDEGYPKFLMSSQSIKSKTISATGLRSIAIFLAKIDLLMQMETNIIGLIENSIANESISQKTAIESSKKINSLGKLFFYLENQQTVQHFLNSSDFKSLEQDPKLLFINESPINFGTQNTTTIGGDIAVIFSKNGKPEIINLKNNIKAYLKIIENQEAMDYLNSFIKDWFLLLDTYRKTSIQEIEVSVMLAHSQSEVWENFERELKKYKE